MEAWGPVVDCDDVQQFEDHGLSTMACLVGRIGLVNTKGIN